MNKTKGKQLITLVDRKTRYSIVRIVEDKTIESINHVMSELNKTYHFKSITANNGSEFFGLDDVLDFPVYYAHPYFSYERGSNENVNRMIRRHIPKGTRETSEDIVNKIEESLNHYPRKLFNFQSLLEHEEVSQLFNSVA